MEQHAIPQQISSYQFRLVGDMTLKQFFQLAGGFLVALIFYSSPLIGIIKWPFVIVSALLGVGLAFLPLEERPLEKWIFAFFRAIYAPTQYYWQHSKVAPVFFQAEPASSATSDVAPPQEKALQEYLSNTSQKTGVMAKLDGAEQGFLATLSGIFTGAVNQVPTGVPAATQPAPQPVQQPTAPPLTPLIKSEPEVMPKAPVVEKTIQIPQTPAIRVVSNVPHLVVEERKQDPIAPEQQITTHQVAPVVAGEEIVSTKQAMFSIDAAPPSPPTIPNVIVGQVVDESRKIIEGAIMEIRDSAGRPIRALRSNRAGHFITVTPLEIGKYDVVTEKDGFDFQPISFEATGNLIPPILVQGKRNTNVINIPAQNTINQNPATNYIN